MKVEINKSISSTSKLNEITLFRAMETSLNKRSISLFVRETHGHAGYVEYISPHCPVPVVKEISDLMIISYNPKNKVTRLCFLQAKFHRYKTYPFLKFRGDYYQWELLRIRPNIKNIGKSMFPSNILSFTKYKSISSFGVFYYDSYSNLDMLFSIPDLLHPTRIKTHKNRPSTTFIFPGKSKCPCAGCFTLGRDEIMTTCNLDIFENLLLAGKVGAPINGSRNIENYLQNAIEMIRKDSENDLLIEISRSFDSIERYEENDFDVPNMLFVRSDLEFTLNTELNSQ